MWCVQFNFLIVAHSFGLYNSKNTIHVEDILNNVSSYY